MTDLDDAALWAGAAPALVVPKRCRRHSWGATYQNDGREWTPCLRCDHVRNDTASRRGRTNRSRGNAIEREVAHKLGLRRVGQYGGPDDVRGDLFAAQVKSGGAFPERVWRWLRAIPVDGGQVPLVILTDAPGPGHARRAIVVLDMRDWIALHGGSNDDR